MGRAVSVAVLCRAYKLPEPEEEHRFAPPRRWRFDYSWPAELVALEVEGIGRKGRAKCPSGCLLRGRHETPAGYEADCEKYNAAAALGWRVFRATPRMLRDDPDATMTAIGRALAREVS